MSSAAICGGMRENGTRLLCGSPEASKSYVGPYRSATPELLAMMRVELFEPGFTVPVFDADGMLDRMEAAADELYCDALAVITEPALRELMRAA